MVTPPSDFVPRAGALAHWDEADRRWVCTNPSDVWFSTRTMQATHFWNGQDWQLIWGDDAS